MRTNVVTIRLSTDDYAADTNLSEKSWLLRGYSQFPDLVILGMLDERIKKDLSLGQLFRELKPDDNGNFELELGVILPDWMPNLNNQRDYWLEIPNSDSTNDILCLSNHMLRLRFRTSDEFVHALVPSHRIKEVLDREDSSIPKDCHIEPLRTMVAMTFTIAGTTAEEAFETNIEHCVDRLIENINQVVGAHLMLSTGRLQVLTPTVDRGTFDYVYLIMKGQEDNELHGHRVALSIHKASMITNNYDEEMAAAFLALINGSRVIDDITRILNSGKSYIEGGLLQFALLQLVIAAEIATTRFTHRILLATGVSKGKLGEYERDLTYSMMLNIQLFSLCPPGLKPDRQLIGTIDKARRMRNDFMHEGTFNSNHDELRNIYDATVQYIKFLDQVLTSKGLL